MDEIRRENTDKEGVAAPKKFARSSRFKYYIHDGVEGCRFQLLGDLTEAEVPELHGCWRTARSTLGTRKLILDLLGLRTVDEAGKQWLAGMAAEGANYLPESYLRTGLAPQQVAEAVQVGLFGKLLALFRGSRVVTSTQAQ